MSDLVYGDVTTVAIPTVVTERLTLRAIRAGDLDASAAMWADPKFMEYLGGPADRQSAWRNIMQSLGHWALWGYGLWTVVENATGDVVGRAGLWNEPGWPGVEAAWFIASSRWGRGYAPEAAEASIRFAFDNVGVDRVVSVIDADNAKSVRVAGKVGETRDHTEFLHGKHQVVYAITRDEWEAAQGRGAT